MESLVPLALLAHCLTTSCTAPPLIPACTPDATQLPTGLPICSAKATCTAPCLLTLETKGFRLTDNLILRALDETMDLICIATNKNPAT